MKCALTYILLLALSMARPIVASNGQMLPKFLAGCWRGELGDGEIIEEQYSSPVAGAIFGVVVSTKNGEITFFEFVRIVTIDEVTTYHPFPNGIDAEVTFTLNEIEPDKLSFENLAHDFPQQISYRLLADDKLLTRVAGTVNGRKLVDEYTTSRVACGAD